MSLGWNWLLCICCGDSKPPNPSIQIGPYPGTAPSTLHFCVHLEFTQDHKPWTQESGQQQSCYSLFFSPNSSAHSCTSSVTSLVRTSLAPKKTTGEVSFPNTANWKSRHEVESEGRQLIWLGLAESGRKSKSKLANQKHISRFKSRPRNQ